jgi:outer membrane protein assembly factor BamD
MIRRLLTILAIIASLSLAACSSVTSPIDEFRGQSAETIYDAGVANLHHHNFSGASNHFEALNALYPFSPNIQQAQLGLIYAYYKQDDVASTLAACDHYIHLYPDGSNVDYAYYMRGLAEMNSNLGVLEHFFPYDPSRRDLTNMQKAYMDFDTLLKGFPKSVYLPDAIQRMMFIRNVIAQHTLEVAQFYMKRGAYVAAANRANEVILNFQETPSVPQALEIMEQAYQKLGLTTQASRVQAVLKLNFPAA